MSDSKGNLDPFIATMAIDFALHQARTQSQQPELKISDARPFPNGADVGAAREKTKYLDL